MDKMHTVTVFFANGNSNCYLVYGIALEQAIRYSNRLLSCFGQVESALLSYDGQIIRIK